MNDLPNLSVVLSVNMTLVVCPGIIRVSQEQLYCVVPTLNIVPDRFSKVNLRQASFQSTANPLDVYKPKHVRHA